MNGLNRSMLAVLIVSTLALSARGSTEPPVVVSMSPEHGQANISPSPSELRIEFDQDMATSYSFTIAGETFPETRGQPRWVTPRVCVLPVLLKPNTEYHVGLNGPSHTGFHTRRGQPLSPQMLWFRTGPGPDGKVPDHLQDVLSKATERENAVSLESLRKAIDERYSYRDRVGLDWDQLFAAHRESLLASETPWQFGARAATLLAATEDQHIVVVVGETTFPVLMQYIKPNCNINTIAPRLHDMKQWSNDVLSGHLDDGTAYLCIASWDRQREQAIRTAFDALRSFETAERLIIDLRLNSGGDENIAQDFAGCFIDDPVVYARHVNRDAAAPGGFSPPFDRRIVPNESGPRYRGRVAVLMGPSNMSSAEAFLLMMKQVPDCTLIGMKSYGTTGNPKPVELPNGVVVRLPSWKGMRLDGTVYEGEGIEPHVKVPTRPEDFLDGDPVLDRAIEVLGGQRRK